MLALFIIDIDMWFILQLDFPVLCRKILKWLIFVNLNYFFKMTDFLADFQHGQSWGQRLTFWVLDSIIYVHFRREGLLSAKSESLSLFFWLFISGMKRLFDAQVPFAIITEHF